MNAPEVCHCQPGQLVECIGEFDARGRCLDGQGRPAVPHGPFPMKGCIYTVCDVGTGATGGIYLTLQGLPPSMAYRASSFRPVQTPSIECFHSLLAPSPASTREAELA